VDLAQLTQDLQTLADDTAAAVANAPDVAALDAIELEVLGKKGRVTDALREIGKLPGEDRPKLGAVANAVRQRLDAAITERRAVLSTAELDALNCHRPQNNQESKGPDVGRHPPPSRTSCRALGMAKSGRLPWYGQLNLLSPHR
jgi:phenylalanyl-tRNA synthetase alpha chain